ncbi:KAP family P-loop domain-containing protein [Candidatus Electrothrix marina]|uniref:KAP family P-loop domain-containing protein n=2 Tax=Candidatus Electrothrix marina TaxID=1859130 RepID=A0A3S3RDG8_9BACT|nr:KAP family P-loop domain-containing protein [Candidatus Electrothrix marina]
MLMIKAKKKIVVQMNAWESDYLGDPLFAIISALVHTIKNQNNEESAGKIINAAKDAGWFVTAIGGQVARKFTGVDPAAAADLAEKKKTKRDEDIPTDAFSLYELRRHAMKSLKSAVKDFVDKTNSGVLFLIDELDRCRPDYAISYLETIKHIFDVKGATFLIAADRNQLENSARKAFGSKLDFNEYYRKFIHREVTLPAVSDSGYRKLALQYVTYYLDREGLRNCYLRIEESRVENIVELISSLKMTPRQIQEVFRILGHSLSANEDKKGKMLWAWGVATILMSILKLKLPDTYQALGRNELRIKDAVTFIKELKSEYPDWWFTLIYTGGGLNSNEIKDMQPKDIYMKADLISEENNDAPVLTQWRSAWGHTTTSSRFSSIFSVIEKVTSWN